MSTTWGTSMWVEIVERAFLKKLCQESYAESRAVTVSHNADRIHTAYNLFKCKSYHAIVVYGRNVNDVAGGQLIASKAQNKRILHPGYP
jgi:hypothetical protein